MNKITVRCIRSTHRQLWPHCINSITLYTDHHLDDFPGNNNLLLLFKVSLYDKKYKVKKINNGK